ncbi:hypothetical protein HYQ44_005576 [Verticillium longisporum]|nr:hypothetical protein HYQ44_005576 [Verticillium longisporum]
MHFSKAAKAVFFIINHVAATHFPANVILAGRLQNDDSQHGSSAQVLNRDLGSVSLPLVGVHLFTRQESCKNCRTRCPNGKIIDKDDCKKCKRCPKGRTANSRYDKCIKNEEGKRQKKEAFDKKKEAKTAEYKDKGRRFEKKKEEKKRAYVDKQDEDKRKKVRRMGRCLALVPLGMGAVAAAEFADEFFDEEYLEDMDLLQFWPEHLPIDPWGQEADDSVYESDDYINKWVTVGEGVESRSISLRAIAKDRATRYSPVTDIAVRSEEHMHQLEERCPFCFLIPIFAAVARTAAAVGSAAARAGITLARGAIRVAKGRGSKRTKKEQTDGARKVSENRNWLNCLRKADPTH